MAEQNQTTLWVSNLDPSLSEEAIRKLFANQKGITNIKMIKDTNGRLSGYGFLEFASNEDAIQALQKYSGLTLPGSSLPLRVNWAGSTKQNTGIYIGELAYDVSEEMLTGAFAQFYSSVLGSKIVTDPATGRPKGFGFVRFSDEAESIKAIKEMQGTFIGGKPIRVSAAKKEEKNQSTQSAPAAASYYSSYPSNYGGFYDPSLYSSFYTQKSTDLSHFFIKQTDVSRDTAQFVTFQMMTIDDEEDHGSLAKFGL